jgi:hypothetical protein
MFDRDTGSKMVSGILQKTRDFFVDTFGRGHMLALTEGVDFDGMERDK